MLTKSQIQEAEEFCNTLGHGTTAEDSEGASTAVALNAGKSSSVRSARETASVHASSNLAAVKKDVPAVIQPSSWLMEDKYEWFRKGHEYASTQTRAIPALSKCTPEELYFAVWAIMRGAGFSDPDKI